MTHDALAQGNLITSQIQARQALLIKHTNVVKQHMPELSAADQSAIVAALKNIHTPVITALQAQLAALTVDYTNTPVQSGQPAVS